MKDVLKNKKVLISITSVLMLAILIVGSIFLFKNNKKDIKKDNQETTNNYVAYIKINPSIKLEYKQICNNNKCEEPIVLKYELINDDAKNIFKDVDLLQNDKTLYKVIDLITETTKNSDIKFDKVEIYSDWKNVQAYMNENSNNKEIYKVSINTNDELNKISNLLIKNEDIPDEMFVSSKDELPEGAHYATKEEAEKYGVSEGTIIYPEQSMKEFVEPERTEEQLQKEYEYYYGNKNQQEQKPSTNNSSETKEELTPNKEIAPGLYQEAGSGFGDYVKGDNVSLVPGGRRYFKFVSTSKLGCADAKDKSACKKSWMDYFAPKVETVKQEYLNMKSAYDDYYPVKYEKEQKDFQEKVNSYKEGLALCESNPEEAANKYYSSYCADTPGYLKYYEDRLKQDPVNKANLENDIEAARHQYEEHLTAYNIYKNLPY